MVPVQPYFVFATYQYHKQPVMCHGIAHIYHYHRNCYEFERVNAIPDGCVDIYFEKGGSGVHARACGTVLKSTYLDTQREHEYFGIRFMPGVLPANLNVCMKDLVNHELDLEDIVQNKTLAQEIEETPDWQKCIHLYIEDYMGSLRNHSTPFSEDNRYRLAEYIKEQIISSVGGIRIQELSQKTGYTARYIHLVFNQYFGISPKMFEEIVKFQYAVQLINHHQEEYLTQIGIDTGYFDQAHFIREFKKYSSVTPAEYRELVRKHAYLQRLNVESF